jgi:hypothetical protein
MGATSIGATSGPRTTDVGQRRRDALGDGHADHGVLAAERMDDGIDGRRPGDERDEQRDEQATQHGAPPGTAGRR